MRRVVKYKRAAHSDLTGFDPDIAKYLVSNITIEFSQQVTVNQVQHFQDLDHVYHIDYMISAAIYSVIFTYHETEDNGVVHVYIERIQHVLLDHGGVSVQKWLDDFMRFVGFPDNP